MYLLQKHIIDTKEVILIIYFICCNFHLSQHNKNKVYYQFNIYSNMLQNDRHCRNFNFKWIIITLLFGIGEWD